MKLLRSFPPAAFALVLLAIVTFCAATGQVTFLLVTGAIAATAWYVCEGPRGYALPRWASHVLIIIASVSVVPDVASHPTDVIGVLGRYTVWLALIKLYVRKTNRDWSQLLWLSLVLVVASALSTRELLFGLALLLYSLLGLYVLLLFHLHGAHDDAVRERAALAPRAGRVIVPPLRPVLGRTVRGQFLGLVALVAFAGLAISVILFIGYPRGVGVGVINRLARAEAASAAGFVEEVHLFTDTGRRITESLTPALEVRVTSPAGAPVEWAGPLYLRGAALDAYDEESHVWKRSPARAVRHRSGQAGPDSFAPLADFSAVPSSDSLADRLYTIEVTPLTGLDPFVFAPWAAIELSTEREGRYVIDEAALTLALPQERRLPSYRVRVDPNPDDAMLRAMSGGRAAAIGGASFVNDAVRDEARRILRQAGLPESAPAEFPARGEFNRRAAAAFVDHFQTGFSYTLDLSGQAIDGDPIEAFLFDFRRGHCEFFASAMTAMCQSVGVDARLVTGFLGSEYAGDGRYLIRESNAHAWVEVRTSRVNWSTFDPTPAGAVEQFHQPGMTLADRVRGFYEIFEVGWIRGFVEYDAGAQSNLRQSLNLDSFAWLDDVVTAVSDFLRRFLSRFGAAGALQIGLLAAIGAVAAVIAVRLVRRARRIRRSLRMEHLDRAEYRRLLRHLGFYLDMLDVLRRGGLAKPDWQPPLAFADVVEARRPEAAPHVRSLTTIFYEARYGGAAVSGERLDAARAALQRLAAALSVRLR